MSLMNCLKQSSITTRYILTIKIKRIFKFFVRYTKEGRNSQLLISSFYVIRFEAGKLKLNACTQTIQKNWKRVQEDKSIGKRRKTKITEHRRRHHHLLFIFIWRNPLCYYLSRWGNLYINKMPFPEFGVYTDSSAVLWLLVFCKTEERTFSLFRSWSHLGGSCPWVMRCHQRCSF